MILELSGLPAHVRATLDTASLVQAVHLPTTSAPPGNATVGLESIGAAVLRTRACLLAYGRERPYGVCTNAVAFYRNHATWRASGLC